MVSLRKSYQSFSIWIWKVPHCHSAFELFLHWNYHCLYPITCFSKSVYRIPENILNYDPTVIVTWNLTRLIAGKACYFFPLSKRYERWWIESTDSLITKWEPTLAVSRKNASPWSLPWCWGCWSCECRRRWSFHQPWQPSKYRKCRIRWWNYGTTTKAPGRDLDAYDDLAIPGTHCSEDSYPAGKSNLL